MTNWRWISIDSVTAIHNELLAEFGGAQGTRAEGGLLSALTRPQNLAAYGEPDAAALAGAYAFGIVGNHPFVDGNKRTGWTLARLFLAKNQIGLTFRDSDAVVRMEALAAGDMTEDEFALWLRERIQEP